MTKRNDVLLSPGFLTGLFVLIVNDFWLKDQFHNALTGKLSDIAGLFIFPLFISALTRSHSKHIFFAVALFFIYWKSPLSDELLHVLSSISSWHFTRVVDYTDLLCLPVLLLSYMYLQKEHTHFHVSRLLIMLVSAFAFMATSQRKSPHMEERELLEEGYKPLIAQNEYLLNADTIRGFSNAYTELVSTRDYEDTLHVFLKHDSIDMHASVFIFYNLKNGNVRLLKTMVYKDSLQNADTLFFALRKTILKRYEKLIKEKRLSAKNDSLFLLTSQPHFKKREDAVAVIDSALKYVPLAIISERQLYELKADILKEHYDPAYKKEILALLDKQDHIDSMYNRSGYSVNRYGKRLDFYDFVREDSLKRLQQNNRKKPKP